MKTDNLLKFGPLKTEVWRLGILKCEDLSVKFRWLDSTTPSAVKSCELLPYPLQFETQTQFTKCDVTFSLTYSLQNRLMTVTPLSTTAIDFYICAGCEAFVDLQVIVVQQ